MRSLIRFLFAAIVASAIALVAMMSVGVKADTNPLQVGINNPPPQLSDEFGPGTYVDNDAVAADHLTNDGIGHTDFEEIAAGDTVGAFRFLCGPAHLNTDDMMVFHGQHGASHPHQYYGNTSARYDSTYASLRVAGQSTCQNILNRSSYWQPAMLNGQGKVIPPDFVSIYYKRPPKSRPECTPGNAKYMGRCVGTPTGISYIFGYDLVTGTTPTGSIVWKCVYNYGPSNGLFDNLIDAAHSCDGLPQNGILHIAASLNAPPCWDGANLDSANHRSHTANIIYDAASGRYACPTDHPYVIPQFTATSFWKVDPTLNRTGVYTPGTTATQWHLSSDLATANSPERKPGLTIHYDYKEGWDRPTKKMWTDNCIDRGLSCSAGDLGNGKMLKQELPALQPDHMPPQVPVKRPKMAKEASTVTIRAPQ